VVALKLLDATCGLMLGVHVMTRWGHVLLVFFLQAAEAKAKMEEALAKCEQLEADQKAASQEAQETMEVLAHTLNKACLMFVWLCAMELVLLWWGMVEHIHRGYVAYWFVRSAGETASANTPRGGLAVCGRFGLGALVQRVQKEHATLVGEMQIKLNAAQETIASEKDDLGSQVSNLDGYRTEKTLVYATPPRTQA
jgi:hypothetical protein